jgi:MFS family permease
LSVLPSLVVAPLAGWLVDHLGRRRISVASDVLSAVSVAGIPVVAWTQNLTFGAIVVLAVAGATFDPAGYTARRSMLPDVARASGMPLERLNGIHQGVFALGWTFGPLVGAGAIAWVGATTAFWLPAGLFVVAAVVIAVLRVGDAGQVARAEREAAGEALSGWGGVLVGLRTLWGDPGLRVITIAVVVLAAIYLPTESVLLPTYFERLGSPGSLGLVISGLAGGSAVGAFGYGWLRLRATKSTIARLSMAGTAIAIIPMALLPPLGVLVAAGFALGLAWGPMEPLLSSMVQARVPPDHQGRVFGVQLSVFYAAPPLAMLAVGAAVEGFGLEATYLGVAAALVVACVVLVGTPAMGRLDN